MPLNLTVLFLLEMTLDLAFIFYDLDEILLLLPAHAVSPDHHNQNEMPRLSSSQSVLLIFHMKLIMLCHQCLFKNLTLHSL